MPQSPDLDRFEPVADPRPCDVPWPQMTWPVPVGVELTGDVAQLTRADPSDADELFRVLDHDAVWAHVPGRPRDPDQLARKLVERCESAEWHAWTVRLRRTIGGMPAGSIVGTTSYFADDVRAASLEIGSTKYAPAVWGSAVNPEAKRLLLGYAFDTLRAGRVQLKTDVRNRRSQQAIARLGARYEGTLRRHFRREDGTVRDSVMFSITAEDLPRVDQRLTARLHESKAVRG